MTKENKQFRLLYVVGIIMVITSHVAGGGITLFTDWFTENSFHMPLFFFASGFFYLRENEEHITKYICKKVKRLLLPLWIYNLAYGCMVMILSRLGFTVGEKLSVYNVFVSSFIYGSAFEFNCPDWFVAQLFIVEIANAVLSKILSGGGKKRQAFIIFTEICLGIMSVILISGKGVSTILTLMGRTCFALSWFAIGRAYKMLQKYDRLNNFAYFCVIGAIQLKLLMTYDYLGYSVVGFCFDNLNIWAIYLAGFTGIAFWLRICKILEPLVSDNGIVVYVGRHTFSIVENQYLGFLLLNFLICICDKLLGGRLDFDTETMKTGYVFLYRYMDCNHFLILYVLAGIFIPISLTYIFNKIINKFFGKRRLVIIHEQTAG